MRLPIGDADVLCIDWDERSVRLMEAGVGRGPVKVRRAVHAALENAAGAGDPAALGEFLRRTLAEHRIRARRALVAIPRQDVVLNLMTLPKGTQDELAAMVHIQIAKELPFAKDQTVIDFAVSPSGPDSTTVDVWVAAVRNQVVDYYLQVAVAAGLRPEKLSLRPYANLAAVNLSVGPAGRTLLVDVGPSLTEIDVFREGRLAYSRAATVGVPPEGLVPTPPVAPSMPKAAVDLNVPSADEDMVRSAIMDTLLVEVNRTIGAYRAGDPEAKIDRIVLAGSVPIDESVLRAFQSRFGVPAQMFSVPAALKWRGEAKTAAYGAVIGLALAASAEAIGQFNLLAPKEPEGERRERIRRVPYRAAIIAGLLTATVAAAYVPVYRKNREIAGLDYQIRALNRDKPARAELQAFEEVLNGWKNNAHPWIDHLKRLAEVFPRTEQAFINKIDFKETKETVGRETREVGEIHLELHVVDEFQTVRLTERINDIRGPDGKALYSARVGMVGNNPQRDDKYPLIDRVIVRIRPAAMAASATDTRPAEAAATRPAGSESRRLVEERNTRTAQPATTRPGAGPRPDTRPGGRD
ncbi:MAG: pilus assembly protein PilM [Phycisphaerae bacterium]